jgi:hypothetical protein
MAILTKAYDGKAIITFNEAKHFYTVTCPAVFKDKLYQPSVTSVIGMKDKSNALVPWAVDQFAERMTKLAATGDTWDRDSLIAIVDVAKDTWRKSKQEAADIGSVCHRVFEAKLQGEDPKLPLVIDPLVSPNFTAEMIEQANNAAAAGLRFIDEHEIKVVQAEAPRWSPTHGYIGTGDLIAWIDGKLSVLDWKTSKRLYATVRLQLSAYKQAYEEEYPGQVIEQRVAVNTGKDGNLTVETYDNNTHGLDLSVFLSLLDIWRWDRENQGQWSKKAPRRISPDELNGILTQ